MRPFSRLIKCYFQVAENDTLKEDHQRLATQNLELRRSVDMLEGRQKHETTYCNEILKRDAQLKRVSNDLQELEHSRAS